MSSITSWLTSSSSSSPATTPSTSPEPVVKASVNPLISEKNPQGVKPCCACPDTKKLRDDCFLKYGSNVYEDGDSANMCKDIVEKHKECMRGFGFKV